MKILSGNEAKVLCGDKARLHKTINVDSSITANNKTSRTRLNSDKESNDIEYIYYNVDSNRNNFNINFNKNKTNKKKH